MMKMNLLNLQKTLDDYGVLISFSGRFSQEIIEELGDAVKKYLETDALSQTLIYNVFSVFIEQTQNIKNYSVKKAGSLLGERIANSGIVAIGKSETGYFVTSGNLVENGDMPALTAKLEEIISLDKSGLKKLYKDQIKKDVIPGSGAGLGLIDMARKSGFPLEYSSTKISDELFFFNLQVQV